MSNEKDYISKNHIIIDNGSGYIKAGLSDEEGARAVFPTIVGYPKSRMHSEFTIGGGETEFFIGADAQYKRGILKLNYPIKHGVIENWDVMEKIWDYTFTNELRVAPEEHNVMITEFSWNYRKNRENMAKIMFEKFDVPGLYIVNPISLPLYSAGIFTGFALDLGDETIKFSPIFDGYKLPNNDYYDFGGRVLTQYFVKIFYEYGYRFYKTNEWEIVKDMKEKACYVALDYEKELWSYKPYDYELPDGNQIILKDQRIRVPEALFKPSLLNILEEYYTYYDSIQKKCYNLIERCDDDIKKDLYNNIVLSGGTSMFNELPERLTKEIQELVPQQMKEEVRVIASPERKFATWIGGSIISSISTFESYWITKTEYEESGASVVHRKCFDN